MEWNGIPLVWQECFIEAWKSFQEGSRPIGALVTDAEGTIIARGKSAAFNDLTDSVISNNELALAEINAMLKLDNRIHTARQKYTLYSTMEPCPLCFGAFYMSGMRNLKFAAKDKWAGSTNLKNATPYMSFKPIQIEGPNVYLEQLSIVLNIFFDHKIQAGNPTPVSDRMSEDYPEAGALARKWYEEKRLDDKLHLHISEIYALVQNELTVPLAAAKP
ncbi:nucleoside deaminase [Planococcus sp. CAU13]|uniref:nucleoside deaminase n=1 Tax=Planococcus sp. CAU13 TaxID=1541197 RepID=UPI00068E6945|nr:nucleoside deaminase [Planococcus sp. CAU13]